MSYLYKKEKILSASYLHTTFDRYKPHYDSLRKGSNSRYSSLEFL